MVQIESQEICLIGMLVFLLNDCLVSPIGKDSSCLDRNHSVHYDTLLSVTLLFSLKAATGVYTQYKQDMGIIYRATTLLIGMQ